MKDCKIFITNLKLNKFLFSFNFVIMYKLLKIIVLLILLFYLPLSAQQSLAGRFGFGIGYNSGIEFSNFSSFNEHFVTAGEKGLRENFFISGLNTYLYFLIIPDTRLAFMYMNGNSSMRASNNPNLYFEYQQSLWSFSIEYTFTLFYLNISPGLMFGKVNDLFEITNYNGVDNFNDFYREFKSNTLNSNLIRFESSSFHLSPTISVEYSITRFLSIRLNYLYLVRLSEDWRFLRKFKMNNVPDNFLANSSLISLGLTVGFMSN